MVRRSLVVIMFLLMACAMAYGQFEVIKRPTTSTSRYIYWFSCADDIVTSEYLFAAANVGSSPCASTPVISGTAVYVIPFDQVLSRLQCTFSGADVGQTWTFTIRLDDVATPVTCSGANPATTCDDLTRAVSATAGQVFSINHADTSSFDGGYTRCSVEGN